MLLVMKKYVYECIILLKIIHFDSSRGEKYSFQPGVKFSCNLKIFNPGLKFQPGANFTPVTCNRPLKMCVYIISNDLFCTFYMFY